MSAHDAERWHTYRRSHAPRCHAWMLRSPTGGPVVAETAAAAGARGFAAPVDRGKRGVNAVMSNDKMCVFIAQN